jgi:hypothetical protein
MSPKNQVNFRVSDEELEVLKAYCEQEDRSQSDVLRELVRSLKRFHQRNIGLKARKSFGLTPRES